jgi:hypothetical protein
VCVAQQPGHHEILDVAVAAVQLDALGRSPDRQLGGREFGEGRERAHPLGVDGARSVRAVEVLGGLEGEGLGGELLGVQKNCPVMGAGGPRPRLLERPSV